MLDVKSVVFQNRLALSCYDYCQSSIIYKWNVMSVYFKRPQHFSLLTLNTICPIALLLCHCKWSNATNFLCSHFTLSGGLQSFGKRHQFRLSLPAVPF